MKYKYFVSYTYSTSSSFGFGNIDIYRAAPITSAEELDTIRVLIEDNDSGRYVPKGAKVVILNWRRFEDPE